MIYDKASLVQIPSGYKSGTLYSVVPNTADGDFTVTGDPEGEATRVNKDGLIESVAADVPRLNYNFIDGVVQPDPHLLLEPTRTNYATNSNDASQWANVSGSQSIIKTQNYSTAPDGTQAATRLQATATGSNYSLIQLSTTSITGNYAGSVYLKSNTGNTENVIVYGRNTSVTSYPIGNQWQRIELQGSGTSGQNLYLFLGSFPNNGSDESIDVLVWGGQIEEGNYATSLIPTSGLAVTRTVDTCVDAGNNTIISSLDGSVFVDLKVTNDSNLKQINLFDGGNNRITISVQFSILSISIVSNVGGTIQTLYSWDVDINTNDRHKIVIRYKENDSKLYYNGLLQTPTTYTGSWFNDGVLDNFSFDKSGAFSFYGKIHQAMVFSEALSDSELETITSYTSFNQMAKALLYTIE